MEKKASLHFSSSVFQRIKGRCNVSHAEMITIQSTIGELNPYQTMKTLLSTQAAQWSLFDTDQRRGT